METLRWTVQPLFEHNWAMHYFEDFSPGQIITHPGITVDEAELVSFASKYDPQSFHTDKSAAQNSIYGGLIASGWHTAAMTMRMLCDSYILDSASMGSPGIDELRWIRPVRPGDHIRLEVTITHTRRSKSKPDRGIVNSQTRVLNQDDVTVMTFSGMGMYKTRSADQA